MVDLESLFATILVYEGLHSMKRPFVRLDQTSRNWPAGYPKRSQMLTSAP